MNLSFRRFDRRSVTTTAPPVRVLDEADPIALVTEIDGDPRLVVSTGLLSALARRERESVLAHALAHLVNRDLRVTTLATVPLLSFESHPPTAGRIDRLRALARDRERE